MTTATATCPFLSPSECRVEYHPPMYRNHTICRDLAAETWMYEHVRAVFDDLFRTIRGGYPPIWETGDGYGGGLIVMMQEAAEQHGFYARTSTPSFTQRRVIKDIVERDGHQCSYCDKTLNTVLDRTANPTVDHVIPRSRGGGDELSNLVLACQSCNSSKGARSITEWSAK